MREHRDQQCLQCRWARGNGAAAGCASQRSEEVYDEISASVANVVEAKAGIKLNIMVPIGGNPSRISWVASYDNFAAYESGRNKLLPDADYMKLVESNTPYFLP